MLARTCRCARVERTRSRCVCLERTNDFLGLGLIGTNLKIAEQSVEISLENSIFERSFTKCSKWIVGTEPVWFKSIYKATRILTHNILCNY
jgi:hypothetical protein